MRALAISLAVVCAASVPSAQAQSERASAEPPVWRTLSRFSGEEEFYRYLRDVRRAERAARNASFLKQEEGEPCPPDIEPCIELGGAEEAEEENIVVTGSRVAAPAPAAPAPSATSITNVQNAGVDEGDIVKLYGRFLIVLQDGRLFSVDTGSSSADLRLVDRIDVYRDRRNGGWYDEILIAGARVVVTGYNYREAATEFSVFSIGEDGRFTRESTYFLSSNDYYDIENYASRLVNGNLVIYTPLMTGQLPANERARWPVVRRWLSAEERARAGGAQRNLYDARDIYRPIQETFDPVVHTISVCSLGSARGGDELECASTAVVAPPGREFYVSTSHVYLWTYPLYRHDHRSIYADECAGAAEFERGGPAAIFQIPLSGGPLRAHFVRGRPYDQLSMDANAREFRALDVWQDLRCWSPHREDERTELPLRYLSTPLSAFSVTPRPLDRRAYTELPSVGAALENRFTDDFLVYGGRERWGSYAPQPDSDVVLSARIVAVPTDNPAAHTIVAAPHNILRVERVGDEVVATGYRDWRGLHLSLVDLGARPHIRSSVFLAERYETEGRSHAFNSAVDPDGTGLMGVPTTMQRGHSGRWWWRSASSDVSYVSLRGGELASVGALRGLSQRDPSYVCEVSCVDWYGNTRALFIGGRIFALSGTELIEGALGAGGIGEVGRVNLTAPPGRRS